MIVRCLYDILVSIEGLKSQFHNKNRNKHPDSQIERLAKILDFQGVRYPVKISKRSGMITSGHGRVLAAEKLGWKEFPVNYQDYESEEMEYLDVQADNAIAAWSEIDLSAIHTDIPDLGPFEISLLGLQNFSVIPEYEDKKEKQSESKSSTVVQCPNCGEQFDAKENKV